MQFHAESTDHQLHTPTGAAQGRRIMGAGAVPLRDIRGAVGAQLVPLPLETHIPCETRRNTAGAVTLVGEADRGTRLCLPLLHPWLEIQK